MGVMAIPGQPAVMSYEEYMAQLSGRPLAVQAPTGATVWPHGQGVRVSGPASASRGIQAGQGVTLTPVGAAAGAPPSATAQQGAIPGSLQARKDALSKELKQNLAISGIAQAAQFGTLLIPSASEIENRRRLKAIQSEKVALEAEAAAAGLSPEEKAQMQAAALAPVQALAREARQREEAAIASMGGSSAADIVRARRESRELAQNAALQASMGVEQADLIDARQDLEEVYRRQQILKVEEDERIEAKGERQRKILGETGKLISGGAGLYGQIGGAQAIQAVPEEYLANLTPLQQDLYLRAAGGDQTAMQQLMLQSMFARLPAATATSTETTP
jgi:hypothetical protein